jgi:exo-1,4-beta-D-glucosaminidase
MMMNGQRLDYSFFSLLILCLLIIGLWSCKKDSCTGAADQFQTVSLEENWHIQSSSKSKGGETVSTLEFKPEGWYPASVPTTVLAALVKNDVYKDIFFGKNLETIPKDQFDGSWWYRKEFTVPDPASFDTARLVFEGINYSAHIWLNGNKIAAADHIKGAFRLFELEVTQGIQPGKNVLAVEVFPPKPGDFTIGFVDWNPAPPDKNMGLWRGVKLYYSGAVSINHPFVQTKVNTDTLDAASLTVSAELVNRGGQPVAGVLKGEIEDILFRQPYRLDPGERKTVTFTPAQFKELNIKNPRLWWPNNLGEPHLYRLKLTALVNEEVSHRRDVSFGIREVSDYINEQGHRGYKINGKKVLIRGGGWVDDLLLADSDEKLEAQFKYVKHMNLNTVRLEGFWGSSHKLYDLADQYGILLMAGWSCQWEWQEYVGKPVDDFGAVKTPEEIELVAKSLRDQVLWLRNHPSIFVWVLGSDKLPRPELEKKYNAYIPEVDPTRPTLAACKTLKSEISGSTAVKMEGPYDYEPPVYWYIDKKHGGAFGFNTETGPGPQPPLLESLRRMLPEENLWPIDELWNYHCGRNEFNTMNRYMLSFNKRYGVPGSVEEFAMKSQAANYEAMRAMFEAFGVNKPNTTGIIQWMLNSAWPEMYWQLYDYYLAPNGAFYGAKTGSQPLNIAYDYGRHAICIVNDTLNPYQRLKAEIRILDLDSKIVFTKDVSVDITANQSKMILDVPKIENLTPVYFVDLKLKDGEGKVKGDNFYWLSTRADTLDNAKTEWFYTPQKEYADFTALNTLPEVDVDRTIYLGMKNNEELVRVTLNNNSDKIAFFLELKLLDPETGRSIQPLFWEDNYISLLPGESKTISGRYAFRAPGAKEPQFKLTGWNLKM